MQLKLFDILSSVIPGALVLCCLFLTSNAYLLDVHWIEAKISIYKDVSTILTAVFIVASYLAGYVVHAIGSWIEPVLWKTWGGRPSKILFSDESPRLGLGSEKLAILSWLKSKSNDPRLSTMENEQLKADDFRRFFQIAKNLAFANAGSNFKDRIEDFSNSYIFSRNILIAFCIAFLCSATLVYYQILTLKWVLASLSISLIVWWRARDRAIYYSREILVAAYYGQKEVE